MDMDDTVAAFCAGSEEERRRIVAALLVDEISDRNKDILALAMGLRRRGELRWSEAAFMLAATIPHQRHTACYELAILWSLQGKLNQAVPMFERVIKEWGLTPAQKMHVARHYARSGNATAAQQLLDEAFDTDASLSNDIAAEIQFHDYLETFPMDASLALYEALRAAYPFLDLDTLTEQILAALHSKTPYSVIRLGDGEGVSLRLSAADESRFGLCYDRARAEFHMLWYSGKDLINNPSFHVEMRRVQRAYHNADCLSLLTPTVIRHEYTICSARGVPAFTKMLRYFLACRNDARRPAAICHSDVNRHLLVKGHLAAILRNRRFVGLISCYSELPQLLREHFGIAEVELHQTLGESLARAATGAEQTEAPASARFMASHADICKRLRAARAGELYLVAAGIFGKIYCDIIKSLGGIAIDIGSVADLWMNVPSRHFNAAEKQLALR